MSIRFVAAGICLVLLCLCTGCDRRIDVDFSYALERGDFERAAELLERGADVNAQFILSKGQTTLILIAREKSNPEAIRFLLDHGADLDIRTFDGRTALHVAAAEGRTEHVHMLLEAGANVNIRTEDGETALQAAHDNDQKTAERLIREAGGTY
jgi:ankyrin repeat protein